MKILITCTDLMAIQFLTPHVKNLIAHGYEVELACSNVGNRIEDLRTMLGESIKIHEVRLERNPVSSKLLKGYRDLQDVIEGSHWDVIWTNEPVMGVITRLAARKSRRNGTKVIYMAHGFHFFKGASKLNWILYYPIERFCARYADLIVTINHEDYERAKQFYKKSSDQQCDKKQKRVVYIPGTGVELSKFVKTDEIKRNSIREELGIKPDEMAIAVVGELNSNKNQQILIRGLAKTKSDKIKIFFMGKGDQREKLENLVDSLGLSKQVHFLGYRRDLAQILSAFDVGSSASIREGLGLNIIEEMSSGLPIIASDNRGHRDIVQAQGGFLFNGNNADEYAEKLLVLYNDGTLRRKMGDFNTQDCHRFALANVENLIITLIEEIEE